MSLYEFGPFQLDAERMLLLDGRVPVALGPKVVETLLALVEHPGDVLAKSALLDRIWPEGYVDEANLAQNVYVVRKTLRARWSAHAIETIPRRGYRFTAPVRRRDGVGLTEPAAAADVRPVPRLGWRPAAAALLAFALVAGTALALFSARGFAARPSLSADGVRLYEIGRYYWNLRTRDDVAKSMKYFAQVVDIDPRDARGYAGLASANAIMGDYEYGPASPKVYFARARAYAREALAIDPDNGEAYAVLGLISTQTRTGSELQMTQALTELRRAIALDPASGPAHEWYGIALLQLGRVSEAYAQLHAAAELDPLSVATTAWLSDAAYLEGRYGDAIAYARETLDFSPQRHGAYETLGLAYEARGEPERAIAAFRRLAHDCAHCRGEAAALLAGIYAQTNHVAQAQAELAIARANARDVSPEDLAVALASVGERAIALSWLRRVRGNYLRAEIANDPRFAALRNDPQVVRYEKPA